MEEIQNEDLLYRRLIPGSVNRDGRVLSTAYMKNWKPDPAISVNIARLSSPGATAAAGPPGFGVGELGAEIPRRISLDVRHDPKSDNYAHALIEGATLKQQCRILADATQVLIPPNDRNP